MQRLSLPAYGLKGEKKTKGGRCTRGGGCFSACLLVCCVVGEPHKCCVLVNGLCVCVCVCEGTCVPLFLAGLDCFFVYRCKLLFIF